MHHTQTNPRSHPRPPPQLRRLTPSQRKELSSKLTKDMADTAAARQLLLPGAEEPGLDKRHSRGDKQPEGDSYDANENMKKRKQEALRQAADEQQARKEETLPAQTSHTKSPGHGWAAIPDTFDEQFQLGQPR